MLLFHGPLYRVDNERQRHARRHEPFTPHLPEQALRHPTVLGLALTALGVAGVWYISRSLPHWPDWTLFPSLMLSALALVAMVIGLGILVVCGLEPLLGRMDLTWDGEPLSSLGIPAGLQRKCESIGYWTADDVTQAVNSNRFPWTKLDYDERQQIERAAQRWSMVQAARDANRPLTAATAATTQPARSRARFAFRHRPRNRGR